MTHVHPCWRLKAHLGHQLRARSHARDRAPEGQVQEEAGTAAPRRKCRGRTGTTKPPRARPAPRGERAGRARCRHRQTGAVVIRRNRRTKSTLQDRRKLDAQTRATSIVWSGVGFACGAYLVCVAVPQRRLRATSTSRPGSRRTGISSRGAAEARATLAPLRGSTRPAAEAREPERRWVETERSGGAAGQLLTDAH